jgi:transposase-like protein
MYVRGLSTQDVSALYGDTFGGGRMSKSTVSRVTQQLNQDFDRWRRRDLSALRVVYLFLDGQYHAARQGTDEKEGVLSAYALLEDGQPVLLHLDVGPRESYDAWLSFLQDLVARGLPDPLLVVMDGAPGLVKAVKRIYGPAPIGSGAWRTMPTSGLCRSG